MLRLIGRAVFKVACVLGPKVKGGHTAVGRVPWRLPFSFASGCMHVCVCVCACVHVCSWVRKLVYVLCLAATPPVCTGEAGVPRWQFARIGQHEGPGHVQRGCTLPRTQRARAPIRLCRSAGHGQPGPRGLITRMSPYPLWCFPFVRPKERANCCNPVSQIIVRVRVTELKYVVL